MRASSPRRGWEKCIETRNPGLTFQSFLRARRSKGLSDERPERRATRRTFQGERDSSSEKKHRRIGRRRSLILFLSFSSRLRASSNPNTDVYKVFIARNARFYFIAGIILEKREAKGKRKKKQFHERKNRFHAAIRNVVFFFACAQWLCLVASHFIIPHLAPDLIFAKTHDAQYAIRRSDCIVNATALISTVEIAPRSRYKKKRELLENPPYRRESFTVYRNCEL